MVAFFLELGPSQIRNVDAAMVFVFSDFHSVIEAALFSRLRDIIKVYV